MKCLPVKSLIQFRSVSKTWKSCIDNAGFVASYSSKKQHILVKHLDNDYYETRFLSIVDDDDAASFALNRVYLTPPRLPNDSKLIGCSGGLLCFYKVGGAAFLWNPSIRRGLHVDVPIIVGDGYIRDVVLGFGVCRVTNDLKIVKITRVDVPLVGWGWEAVNQVDVWTLSTRLGEAYTPISLVIRFTFVVQSIPVV
ncbi:putative F-box protein At1g47790 [Bidens hawaiensis]|uniref:putative F-box protein At1g47790 n=1 Tax=Bidens hawaiensis TaxID=980011 RepID=UPI00404B1F47